MIGQTVSHHRIASKPRFLPPELATDPGRARRGPDLTILHGDPVFERMDLQVPPVARSGEAL